MTALFGGGKAQKEARASADAARADAQAASELSRRTQAVANDRQLASLATQDSAATAKHRNPRGRRLFTDNTLLA
jgi:hypothetical protein